RRHRQVRELRPDRSGRLAQGVRAGARPGRPLLRLRRGDAAPGPRAARRLARPPRDGSSAYTYGRLLGTNGRSFCTIDRPETTCPGLPPAAPSPRSLVTSGLVDSPPRHGAPPRRRWLRRLLLGTGAAAVLATAAGVGIVLKLSGNVRHEDVSGELGAARPPKVAASAVNVLIVGSDQRDGRNARYGHRIEGERTDTIMLAHLSARRDGVVVISFPRDSIVPLPPCRPRGSHPGQRPHIGMINESFHNGGIGCISKTIEELTGIRVDHFVKVDFSASNS